MSPSVSGYRCSVPVTKDFSASLKLTPDTSVAALIPISLTAIGVTLLASMVTFFVV